MEEYIGSSCGKNNAVEYLISADFFSVSFDLCLLLFSHSSMNVETKLFCQNIIGGTIPKI